ncbi:hypothetical protein, partial [Kluyvera cryocrescens]|uniref:hypothetical protein n=1 Tax=Kluyvera cryocrescens TaxID=580 RepID=UPI00248BF54A
SLWAAPASRQRLGDSDATHAAVVFSLKTKIEVAGTDESPLSPFTDTVVSCSAKHKVNGIPHSTAKKSHA